MRARDEADAYEKLKACLRGAAEACIEIGTRRSDGRWAKMAELYRRHDVAITQLAMSGKSSRLVMDS